MTAESLPYLPGWSHSTRSVAAHWFEGEGYPACQDSDPGEVIPHEPGEAAIGRLCEGCVRIVKSRIMRDLVLARKANAATENDPYQSPKEGS